MSPLPFITHQLKKIKPSYGNPTMNVEHVLGFPWVSPRLPKKKPHQRKEKEEKKHTNLPIISPRLSQEKPHQRHARRL